MLTLLLFASGWLGIRTAQAQIADSVGAWGDNADGQTTIPIAAQSGVTMIAAAGNSTAALRSDGSVIVWGASYAGQTTVPVAALTGVTAIAAGVGNIVALKTDGSVVVWGASYAGQTTVPVAARTGVTAIAAGTAHIVALKNGSVLGWGSNASGQSEVPAAAQSGVAAIAAGGGHTVALKTNGSVIAWGANASGQRTVPVAAQTGVRAIAAGAYHTVALKTDGSVVTWGAKDYDYGQTTVPVAAQSGVMAIVAGEFNTVALKNDGSVVAWGAGTNNTGYPNYGQSVVPTPAQGRVTAIAAGIYHTVVLVIPLAPIITSQPIRQAVNVWQSPSFTVTATGFPLNYQWRKDGVNIDAATGNNYSLPLVQIDQAGSYTVVVSNGAGSETSAPAAELSVDPDVADGTVVAWGNTERGQTTVPVAAQTGVAAIAAGPFHTVALKNDGTLVAWGLNISGQVTGTATTAEPYWATANPVTIEGQVLSGVTTIAAGFAHTVALKSDGTVVAWGQNGSRQVTGTSTTIAEAQIIIANPVTLGGQVLKGVTAIAAGGLHTLALKSDGSVVGWGASTGDGNYNQGQATVPIAAQSGVIAIAAGPAHSVALKNDGTVVAWGADGYGQVTGDPTHQSTSPATGSPVTLKGKVLSGITAITAGGRCFDVCSGYTVALKDDGTITVWGLADSVPAGLIGVTAIAAGAYHTMALKNDGTLVAWGQNEYGQVTGNPANDLEVANPVTLRARVLSGVKAIAAGYEHTVALLGPIPLRPTLNARPRRNELVLSWSTNAAGFSLQATTDLTPPVTWTDSANPPVVIGTQLTVTNRIFGSAQFYRLTKLRENRDKNL